MAADAEPTAASIIEKLGLEPHPEGGFFRRVFTHPIEMEGRAIASAIDFLLQAGDRSQWHRFDAIEMWHFYAGDPLLIHTLDSHGAWNVQRLGNMLHQPDAVFQCVVPAGCWFAAQREGSQGYSLVGCTVAPGFEFATFELADAQALIRRHPEHQAMIRRLAPR